MYAVNTKKTHKWYHYSGSEITSLYDVKQDRDADFSPKGLWLSYNNEWMEWLEDQGYSKDSNDPMNLMHKNYYNYEIDYIDDLNLIRIETPQDLEDFVNKYSTYLDNTEISLIQWNEISKHYDGIMFLNYHELKQCSLRYKKDMMFKLTWFNIIDINSCCIWNASKLFLKLVL